MAVKAGGLCPQRSVVMVASGGLAGIDVRRRDEPRDAVSARNHPLFLVDDVMMV